MIEEYAQQRLFTPIVERPLASTDGPVVIGGMGGSAFAGESLGYLLPGRSVTVHRDYGLPLHGGDALYVAVSHSGNTEETLSFANAAQEAGKKLAIVSSGGKLAEFAAREGLPFVSVPNGLQPRYSLIYMTRALLALLEEHTVLTALAAAAPDHIEEEAEVLAKFLLPSVPLFYASTENHLLAKLGKIMLNETAHMPAFANVFPELNHNEMQAFDTDMPEGLRDLFRFVLIKTDADDARIERRMSVFADLQKERGRAVHIFDLRDANKESMLLTTWLTFMGTARFLAETHGIDPDTVPLIEEFKKRI